MATVATLKAPIVNGKKTFIPLENNPETLTTLARSLGLSPRLAFHDVLSFSEAELLAMTPRPAIALILIVPANIYNANRARQFPSPSSSSPNSSSPDASLPSPKTHPPSTGGSPVYWARQTIGHACGSMSLLHAAFNLAEFVERDSTLASLLAQTLPLDADARAQAIYDCQELERAHMAAAGAGSSRAPDPSEPNALHFITFVKSQDGRLWELEGGWDGPIDLGSLDANEDLLSARAIELGVGRAVKIAAEMGEIEFSAVAVVDEGAP